MPPITDQNAHQAASRKARRRSASIIGSSITSGGIGKKDASAKAKAGQRRPGVAARRHSSASRHRARAGRAVRRFRTSGAVLASFGATRAQPDRLGQSCRFEKVSLASARMVKKGKTAQEAIAAGEKRAGAKAARAEGWEKTVFEKAATQKGGYPEAGGAPGAAAGSRANRARGPRPRRPGGIRIGAQRL